MNEKELRELLEQVEAGNIGPDDALNSLRRLPFADLGHARIDHHRSLRTGAPEAVYGPNKSPEHCVSIVSELLDNGTGPVLLTRATNQQIDAVQGSHPDATIIGSTVVWRSAPPTDANVVVAAAGTADLSVADEACAVLGVTASPRSVSLMWVWLGCTGCWLNWTRCWQQRWSSLLLGWKVRWLPL